MTFCQMLPKLPIEDGRARLTLTADWAQGRATFGGLSAAAVLRVMRSRVEPERTCRSLLVSFAGPVAPGEADITTAVVRRGRSATFTEGRVLQAGEPRCLVLASFGGDRESAVTVNGELSENRPASMMPRPDQPRKSVGSPR